MASQCGGSGRLDSGPLDSAAVEALYREHAAELHRFLVGVLRDDTLASDAVQLAFIRAIEVGHTTQEESRKAWLFRVAYREALAIRRREATGERVLRHLTSPSESVTAQNPLITHEEIERIRIAIENLPTEQRAVLQKRIHEDKTFAEIAQELGIPLGTALTRMRTALGKLRGLLRD
jgi:RNA polymerase sigma-70 factor (ECF subfamily)